MSTLRVDTITNNGSAVDLPQKFKIGGSNIEQGYTASGSEPSSPATGDFWWDSSNEKLYRYINGEFKELTVKESVVYGDRGFRFGLSSPTNQIDYWDFTTANNAQDFGDLNFNTRSSPGCSDGTYIYVFSYTLVNIDFFASATVGNATDFGDQLNTNTFEGGAGCDGTIAVQMHGMRNNGVTDVIDKIAVGTAGVTATTFGGTSTTSNRRLTNAFSSKERMACCGGSNSNYSANTNLIEYITFATESNATDAGDLTVARYGHGAADTGEGSVGLCAGGYDSAASNVIDRKDITTTSNATDHGDLAVARYYLGGCSNATKAHFFGGYPATADIQETNLATAGNATQFADMTQSGYNVRGTSGPAS